MGWFMQNMLNRLLHSLPVPQPPPQTGLVFRVLMFPSQDKGDTPFPLTFPSQHSSEEAYIEICQYTGASGVPALPERQRKWRLVQMLSERQGVAFFSLPIWSFVLFLIPCSFHCKVVFSVFELLSPATSSRHSVSRGWSNCWFFFFFLHKYNWQVMKLCVTIFTFFLCFTLLSKKKNMSEQGVLEDTDSALFDNRVEDGETSKGLLFFILFCSVYFFFAAKRLRSFIFTLTVPSCNVFTECAAIL